MTASTLIYIKSRSLLPKPEILQEESPEAKLIQTLVEYDNIKKISQLLKKMEGQTLVLWKREEVFEEFQSKEFELEEVSSFQLAEVFLNIIKKKDREEFLYVDSKEYSIEKKWDEIMELLEQDGYLDLYKYVETLKSIEEVLVTFFCTLEMIRQRVIVGVQKQLFAPISIWKTNREDDPVQ